MRPDAGYTGLLIALAIAPGVLLLALLILGALMWLFTPDGQETEAGFRETAPCAWDDLRCQAAEVWHMMTSRRPMAGDDWEDE